MPKEMNPDHLSVELLLTDHHLKLIPKEELPEATRQILAKASLEQLPVIRPKPLLNHAQMRMLEIVAELSEHGEFDWGSVLHFYAAIHGLSEAMVNVAGRKIGDALVRRRLLTAKGPLLTLQGHARVKAEGVAEVWRERLGLREYPLDRVERNPDSNYDEVYFEKDGLLQCYFRYECFEIRPKAKIVVLAHLPPPYIY